MNNVHLILLVSFIKIYFVDTYYFAKYIYFFLHAVRLHDSCGIHWFSFPLGHSSLMIPISSQYCKDFKNESRVVRLGRPTGRFDIIHALRNIRGLRLRGIVAIF